MTNEEYIKERGEVCPVCRSRNIGHVDDLEVVNLIESKPVYVTVTCNDCGRTWTEEYALAGFDLFPD